MPKISFDLESALDPKAAMTAALIENLAWNNDMAMGMELVRYAVQKLNNLHPIAARVCAHGGGEELAALRKQMHDRALVGDLSLGVAVFVNDMTVNQQYDAMMNMIEFNVQMWLHHPLEAFSARQDVIEQIGLTAYAQRLATGVLDLFPHTHLPVNYGGCRWDLDPQTAKYPISIVGPGSSIEPLAVELSIPMELVKSVKNGALTFAT